MKIKDIAHGHAAQDQATLALQPNGIERAAFEAGELGWKVERVSHGEDKGAILWIARRVTPAHAERWPELRVGRWILLEVDGTTLRATQWSFEPGRLGPKRERDEDVPFPW